jgi:hypothetical protein
VCQDHNSRAGAFTAHQQQYTALQAQGQQRPNLRQQILTDLEKLILIKQQEGYCPILMMDANGDIQHTTALDIELRKFIKTTNLADMFYIKLKESPRTYMWGMR